MPSPITFICPLPADDLRFESMTATQAVSALDAVEVTLVSPRNDIAAEKLLGEPARVEVLLREGGKRHFNGIVARFGMGRSGRGRHYRYHATLRPWLWFLTRTSDCRIFQDMTVPEIVEKVFGDHGAIANFEFKLFASYRKRVYCVQYRESDYQFVARLLEEEGIYWFFEHGEGTHKLMLVDDIGSLAPAAGAETLPYHALTGSAPPDVDYVSGWSCVREVRTGKCAFTSYDFERPSTPLLVEQAHARSHSLDDLEQFDFEGDYTQKPDGQHIADVRLDEQQARFERLAGSTNARALAVGHLFTLERHPRADQNAQYLCAQLNVSAHLAPYESGAAGGAGSTGGGGGSADFQCQFTAAPSSQAFRPERRTPKPFVQGPQTAVVVGPSGEEIFTDKYGRVKVQFHWDRLGKKNEKSSCWVRVSTPWAGKSFGFVQIPRIGQEVIVDFLEGDPDQPIITGRVYNAEQMPPWDLPANATQSGVLTRSSKGGAYGNANAIRFEDKKGSEQLWIHAEKNMDIEVENDETHSVGNDRRKTIERDEVTSIGRDRTEMVGRNEGISIIGDRVITVGKSETAAVALQRTHTVGINETIAIGAAQEVVIGAAQAVAIGASQTVSVGANQTLTVGADRTVNVGAQVNESIGGERMINIGGGDTLVADSRGTKIAKDDTLHIGKKFVLEADEEIMIKTGDASITMKKDGTIQIKGKDITVTGSGKIGVKASGDVVIKGSKIAQN
ncbi:MAG: type VI secretion system tip protein VgrG [Burkholderiales bacterium]|nr:type VI secretion system tip protein VgrG [Burkholderiales bacterium]